MKIANIGIDLLSQINKQVITLTKESYARSLQILSDSFIDLQWKYSIEFFQMLIIVKGTGKVLLN